MSRRIINFLFVVLMVFTFVGLAKASFHQESDSDKGDWANSSDDRDYEEKFNLDNRLFSESGSYLELRDELNLTENQIKEIKKIKVDIKKALIQKHAEIKVVSVDLLSQLGEVSINQDLISALIKQKYELLQKHDQDVISKIIQLRSILNEEQKKKLQGLYQNDDSKFCPYKDRNRAYN